MELTEGADGLTTGADNQQNEQDKNKSILKEKLETEFPLSGGETEEEWQAAIHDADENDETTEQDEKKELKRRLNTEFPLSGGEAA